MSLNRETKSCECGGTMYHSDDMEDPFADLNSHMPFWQCEDCGKWVDEIDPFPDLRAAAAYAARTLSTEWASSPGTMAGNILRLLDDGVDEADILVATDDTWGETAVITRDGAEELLEQWQKDDCAGTASVDDLKTASDWLLNYLKTT